MNFCGGGFEQQVSEPPIVTMRMQPVSEDLFGGESSQPQHRASSPYHHVDLSVHPTCTVTSSVPQNSGSTSTTTPASGEAGGLLANSKTNKKKLKQDSSSHNHGNNGNTTSGNRSMSRSRARSKQRSSTSSRTKKSNGSPEQQRRRTIHNSSAPEPSVLTLTPSRPPQSNDYDAPMGSPSVLNARSPQRPNTVTAAALGNTSAIRLPLMDSGSRTMESLLQKLEHGFRVTVHNGSEPRGKRVILKLQQGRTCLMIRPVDGQDNDDFSIKFPVHTILRLEIGKTKTSVLNRTMYDRVHPLTCFSIVVKLWTEAETYFDFEAATVLEREALIATLMVVLDQIHCSSNDEDEEHSDDDDDDDDEERLQHPIHPEDAACLSPGKRTRIFSTPFFQQVETHEEGEQVGTEMTLAVDDDDSDDGSIQSNNNGRDPAGPKKPLRQRQIQPEKEDKKMRSPPRTTRILSSSSSHRHGLKKPLLMSLPRTQSLKAKFRRSAPIIANANENSKHNHQDEQRQQQTTDETRDVSPVVHSTSNNNDTLKVIAIKASYYGGDEDDPRDVSYEVVPQGLPMMDKLSLTPKREFKDRAAAVGSPRNLNADDATVREVMANHQGAWCSDDICTLALRDIAQSCTGIWHQSHCGNAKGALAAAGADDERAHVEEYIADALGGQQMCTLGIYGGDVWNVDKSQQARNNQDSELPKTRIKNRASLLNAQAMRLRALRNEMTFAAALKRSKEKLHYVQTTKSFDDVDSQRLRQAQERSVNRLHSSALIEHVMGTMVFQQQRNNNGAFNGADEDTVYYDSDPEDVRIRTKGVRRASANRRNVVAADEEHRYQSRPVLSGAGFERIALGKKLRKLDERLIIEIVQTMRNETMTLMWHPTQSKAHPNRQPVCVNVWIESGVYLVDGSFVLPRLSWSTAYENGLHNKKLNVSKADPEQIDLLDVCRIHTTEKIDRKLHPFPDARKSFVVETQDEVCLFEAQTSEERDRIVYGYKLVIARLASLLMLRDSRAVEEFFGSVNAMVPGAEPNWARK